MSGVRSEGASEGRAAPAGRDPSRSTSMITAAVVVPAAPALLPGIGGTADPLADLRERAAALVADTATAKGADRLVVVGAGPETRQWPLDAPSGTARFTTGRVPDGALPSDLEIGRLLAPSRRCEIVLQSVAADAEVCAMLADALERAASADRAKIIAALESSTFSGHVMPYGPTKFVNGQNQGAAPVNTQVLGKDIQVILPAAFASAKAVFPMPPA